MSLDTNIVQGIAPTQEDPLQPANADPLDGDAVKVALDPALKLAEHVLPQEMPAGELVMVPLPGPEELTVIAYCGDGFGFEVNVAVTLWSELRVTVQAPVPVQAPLQPANADPAFGTAARDTTEPAAKGVEHEKKQLTPEGELVTLPPPVPALVTFKLNAGRNIAVTATSEVAVTEQLLVPEHIDPLQPAKIEPGFGAALSVRAEPEFTAIEQVAPQFIPAGLLTTVPDPAPLRATATFT